MAIDSHISDSSLKVVLETSQAAREQALVLVDLLEQAIVSDPEHADSETQAEIAKQQKLLTSNVAQLRGLHRSAQFGARETKGQTADARQEVDRLHLQLQNLYYEQRHLEGEIAACESFESVSLLPCLLCLPPSCRALSPLRCAVSKNGILTHDLLVTNTRSYL